MTFAFLIELLGIPANASREGFSIDSMMEMLHWFMLILFVGWTSFYFYSLWRFQKKKSPQANYHGITGHLPTKLEGGILVLEVVLLLSFAIPIWSNRVDKFPTGPDAIHLRAVGQQYSWNFQYTGADGKFGRRNSTLVNASNSLGLDRTDPDAFDDLVCTGEMHVPVNHPVIVNVLSKDVIHDYCIPSMRVAQDAIPGSDIPTWFTPIKVGTYEIVCAQLCGSGHSAMKGTIVVDTEAEFNKWFKSTASSSGATVLNGQPLVSAQDLVQK